MVSAVIGFRAHSGWASAVALGGPATSPRVLDRRRIVTADPAIPGSKQPFHAAEGLPFGKAKAFIDRCTGSSRALARRAIDAMITDLGRRSHAVGGVAILVVSSRPLPDLEQILASHARIHAAEGVLFRDVLFRAVEESGLPATRVAEREIDRTAPDALRISRDRWLATLAVMGKAVGPPWRQDEKLAATAAWIALAGPILARPD